MIPSMHSYSCDLYNKYMLCLFVSFHLFTKNNKDDNYVHICWLVALQLISRLRQLNQD